jgi:hypothetical protein
VPVPAKAFSISSMITITRGRSMPRRTDCRKLFTLLKPPRSSKVSPPRQTDKPGVCSMICRLRFQRSSVSSSRLTSEIASACSARKAAKIDLIIFGLPALARGRVCSARCFSSPIPALEGTRHRAICL